jgi:amidase
MKKISKDHRIDSFSAKSEIALRVDEGEIFAVETYNALADLEGWKRARESEKPMIPNLTGPLYVEGAKSGNVLKVDILDLKITAQEGMIVALPGKGGLKETIKQLETKIVKIDQHFVYFSENIRIPISPMIGKIGVAP